MGLESKKIKIRSVVWEGIKGAVSGLFVNLITQGKAGLTTVGGAILSGSINKLLNLSVSREYYRLQLWNEGRRIRTGLGNAVDWIGWATEAC